MTASINDPTDQFPADAHLAMTQANWLARSATTYCFLFPIAHFFGGIRFSDLPQENSRSLCRVSVLFVFMKGVTAVSNFDNLLDLLHDSNRAVCKLSKRGV